MCVGFCYCCNFYGRCRRVDGKGGREQPLEMDFGMILLVKMKRAGFNVKSTGRGPRGVGAIWRLPDASSTNVGTYLR